MNTYDDEYADSLSTAAYGQPQQPQKSWFGRNWLWFLPTIILLPIFCCCGGGGALIYFGVGALFETPPYKDSLALAEQNAEVQNAIGTPVESPEGFLDLVSMMQNGGDVSYEQVNNQVTFEARIPLAGPNGTATLYIEAESSDGGLTWTYTTQEVALPDGSVVDLIQPGTRNPAQREPDVQAPEAGEVDNASDRELVPDQE